jgi:hypothetical protein
MSEDLVKHTGLFSVRLPTQSVCQTVSKVQQYSYSSVTTSMQPILASNGSSMDYVPDLTRRIPRRE